MGYGASSILAVPMYSKLVEPIGKGNNSSNSLDELLASTDLNPPHLTNLSQLVEIIYYVFKQETRRLEQSASPLCEGYVTPGEEEKACKDVLTNEEQLDRTKWNS